MFMTREKRSVTITSGISPFMIENYYLFHLDLPMNSLKLPVTQSYFFSFEHLLRMAEIVIISAALNAESPIVLFLS